MRFLIPILLCCSAYTGFSQLRLIVDAIPVNTPPKDSIFVAGSFNDWNPSATAYLLRQKEKPLTIDLYPPKGKIAFKFTRGNWSKVESKTDGGFVPNREVSYEGSLQILHLTIESWEDMSKKPVSQATNNQVITKDFFMPQLGRERRVWIYLPPDYEHSGKSYPVLYLQDGQNIFDPATSFAGEWAVDETLNRLHAQGDPGAIVVAVGNGGTGRMDEYSPWTNPRFGGGLGDEYAEFIVETLKPHIDHHYRTLSDPANTAIMGSSMGGLISLYSAIEFQQVFGKVGVFSPSFWFSKECYQHVQRTGRKNDLKVYLLAGQLEGSKVVADTKKMYQTLLKTGFPVASLQLVIQEDGKHQEWFWSREFEKAYRWLFDR